MDKDVLESVLEEVDDFEANVSRIGSFFRFYRRYSFQLSRELVRKLVDDCFAWELGLAFEMVSDLVVGETAAATAEAGRAVEAGRDDVTGGYDVGGQTGTSLAGGRSAGGAGGTVAGTTEVAGVGGTSTRTAGGGAGAVLELEGRPGVSTASPAGIFSKEDQTMAQPARSSSVVSSTSTSSTTGSSDVVDPTNPSYSTAFRVLFPRFFLECWQRLANEIDDGPPADDGGKDPAGVPSRLDEQRKLIRVIYNWREIRLWGLEDFVALVEERCGGRALVGVAESPDATPLSPPSPEDSTEHKDAESTAQLYAAAPTAHGLDEQEDHDGPLAKRQKLLPMGQQATQQSRTTQASPNRSLRKLILDHLSLADVKLIRDLLREEEAADLNNLLPGVDNSSPEKLQKKRREFIDRVIAAETDWDVLGITVGEDGAVGAAERGQPPPPDFVDARDRDQNFAKVFTPERLAKLARKLMFQAHPDKNKSVDKQVGAVLHDRTPRPGPDCFAMRNSPVSGVSQSEFLPHDSPLPHPPTRLLSSMTLLLVGGQHRFIHPIKIFPFPSSARTPWRASRPRRTISSLFWSPQPTKTRTKKTGRCTR